MPFLVQGIIGRVSLDQEYLHLRAEHDGNCLFHAVGFLLERLGLLTGDDDDAAKLRAKVVKWIKRKLEAMDDHDLIVVHILGVSDVDAPDSEIERTKLIDRYLEVMAADKTWADTLCVHALEHLYGVAIEVYGLPGKTNLHTSSVVGPNHALKLVCPAAFQPAVELVSGRKCHNHYDPLVPVAARGTLAPSVTHDPGAELVRTPWPYWLHHDALELYGPPICHAQFHVTKQLARERPKKSFWSAFSSAVHIDVARIAGQIHLVNRKEKAAILSSACPALGAEEAFRPEFLCPLARESGRVVQRLDLAAMQVLFSVKGSKRSHVCFQVYGRKDSVPRVQARLSLAQIEELRKARDFAPPDTYTDGDPPLLAATDVLSVEQWAELSWEHSPYQLVVAPCGESDQPDLLSASWTYFQIPCAWDVDIVEAYASERLILMGDRLKSLVQVEGATVEPRTEETDASMTMSKEEQTLLSLAMRGLGENQTAYSNHATNAIVEREDGRFFAMTSWASMIVLKRSCKTGGYYAHSLYYHSQGRALYVLRKGAMDLAEQLREDTERLEALGKQIAEARAAASSESTTVGKCENAIRERQKSVEKEATYLHELETLEMQLRTAGDTKTADAYAITIEGQRAKLERASQRLEQALLDCHEARQRYEEKIQEIEESIAPLREEQEERKRKIAEGGVVLREWSIRRDPVASLDGVGDFDYDATPTPGWYQILFEEDELPLTHAITSGISSCAGGVTFTLDEGSPDVILFWHVDAPPTVPVKDVIAELFPDLQTCPPLRSIVSIHPSVWEMNKYRKDNLYPKSIQGRCETLFLARGSHLYDVLSAVVCGSDCFGVDVSDPDDVRLVLTHDMDKRTPIERGVDSRSEVGLSIGLCDFSANIYGDYRYKGKAIEDTSSLKAHLSRLSSDEISEVKAHMARQRKVCRLSGLGPRLFGALSQGPTCFTLLDSPCFALGAKGDLEVAHGSAERHYDWRPGPLLPPPESEDKPEKEGEKVEKSDDEPPQKSVQLPSGLHSLSDPDVDEWSRDSCRMCGHSPVRARYSCSSSCKYHHAKLCVRCASSITGKICDGCKAAVELWDMQHDEAWS
ncbi:hypothetical protein [Nannocystis punicea]|uniref:OTU domain-containing protein n=1 Tax=Nannocystis punicea TaxID=2995304 RepID=A0ABY7HDN7_9BACT|nr:hypothetical protein [Nannocystis poenicansa]WAS97403.1 hypothetical protein O0S08_14745 [Nannocystis poenicansa]